MDTGAPSMFNRYAYIANDPINGIDPDGRCGPVCYDMAKEEIALAENETREETSARHSRELKGYAAVGSMLPIGRGVQIGTSAVKGAVAKGAATRAANRRLGNVLGKIKDRTGATAKDIGDAAGLGTGPLKEGAKATTAQIGKLKDLGLSKKDVKAIAKGYKDSQKRGTGGDVAGGRAKYFKDIAKEWNK